VQLYNKLHGAKISAAPAGTVTIRNLGAGTAITTLTAAALTKALGLCTDMPAVGTLTCKADAACSNRVTIVGRNASGVLQAETVTLNGTNNVSTTGSWTYVDYLAVGELAAARTLTLSGVAGSALYGGGYDTLQKQLDYYNSKDGFDFVALSGALSFLMVNMDIYAATNIKTTPVNFGADLYWIITGINNYSALVTAERQSPGTTSPSNTTTPVYLAGGNEGSTTPGLEGTPTASHADWEDALDLLKQLYVNTIVVLTADPSVHADLKSHIAYMCGAGRMERDGVVGIMNSGVTGRATKAEIKTQIIALNTRHLRIVAQQCERYNSDGIKTKMDEPFTACLVAGSQAGTEVGTSLTRKYINTLGMYGDSSWNPKDDADELIEAGLMFAEQVDGKGNRWVRNITSHLSTSNVAYTEASVNQATNYAVYNFRTEMEAMVGEKGFAGTVQAADGRARNKLDLLMDEVLTGWRSLLITLLSDVMEIAVEMLHKEDPMSNVRGKTFTAPRCRIMVDGKIIGWGTNVTVNVVHEHQDVDVIDSLETVEYAPISYKVSGTIGTVGVVGSTYKSMGLVPMTGKDAEEHLLNVLQDPDHSLVLMDKAESRNIVTITKVKFMTHGFNLAAGGIAGRNVEWRAIRETDESEASL
jgi:hypothetical protein